eukprot:SAG11_NODE_3199_length_2615_cov_1484.661765_4_plen_178_part_00
MTTAQAWLRGASRSHYHRGGGCDNLGARRHQGRRPCPLSFEHQALRLLLRPPRSGWRGSGEAKLPLAVGIRLLADGLAYGQPCPDWAAVMAIAMAPVRQYHVVVATDVEHGAGAEGADAAHHDIAVLKRRRHVSARPPDALTAAERLILDLWVLFFTEFLVFPPPKFDFIQDINTVN